ncbi:hypothetical protein E5676_scaffold255G003820 [Cucumis melo var. makuwa]|uniref:Uncharacterized protein n=1 Tax=Cucumis melo var. makuwa TaxID=1194695 RepID=A0A5D3CLL9_CUCMM|nr:hypothetical protein E6C27_scaffold18G001980 [Cucumis melo var. makuwa]TYK12793.1 hypothetical protein E5676_scaffold255G003820 [Cucumis melo var. makuwa]
MSTHHRKVLSQGNIIPHHQNPPGLSKFRDFQALALHLHSHSSSTYKNPDASQFDHLVSSKIPPPPCRFPPYNAASAKEELDDPFLVAYKECTKSVKNKGINNLGVVKKSKFFFGRFSCKTIDSCDITDQNSFFKLPRDTIHVSTWK